MSEIQLEHFGTTIKDLRKKQHMTQKMLAEGICSQSVLSRIENGLEIPNVLVLQNICQRLNVSMDKLLYTQPTDIQRVSHLFHQIHIQFLQQNYASMLRLLENPMLTATLHLDTDFQVYYFYLGLCELHIKQSYDEALSSFKKGLFYSYNKDNENISASEVQLMSMIGRTYSEVGNYEQAQEYLVLSYEALDQLSIEVQQLELVMVFYHYSAFLLLKGELEQAMQVAKEGIAWTRDRRSDFYLEELFVLVSQIYQEQSTKGNEQKYRQLAKNAQKIRENGVDLS